MDFRDTFEVLLDPIPHNVWHALTWLGDSALLLPVALFVALWLAVPRRTRPSAGLWVLCFGAVGGLVLVSKLAFLGWGIGSARLDFTGFSGHTALAAVVWPVVLWLLLGSAGGRRRRVAAAAGWALAAAIGLSRLALEAHSVTEVAAGLALGAAGSAAFLVGQRCLPSPALRPSLVLGSLLLPLALQHPGEPAPTQDVLERIAVRLAGIEAPYSRADLRRQ